MKHHSWSNISISNHGDASCLLMMTDDKSFPQLTCLFITSPLMKRVFHSWVYRVHTRWHFVVKHQNVWVKATFYPSWANEVYATERKERLVNNIVENLNSGFVIGIQSLALWRITQLQYLYNRYRSTNFVWNGFVQNSEENVSPHIHSLVCPFIFLPVTHSFSAD